ncbi:MAG: hypothetical protein IJU44_12135 [Kiritimatiellae bacterium]|nr:hypothetical protein [Kiritimatiellia bacterium]
MRNAVGLFLVFFIGAGVGLVKGEMADEFKNPPKDQHPETWFHFIGGNVAEKGIVADLDAISSAGISGVQFFHGQFGGPWPGVQPQIKCLSESWDGLVGRLADECKSRGLRFTMQNCPGWAMSGGPWIAPSNAMRHLVYSRTEVKGGQRVSKNLPFAPNTSADWRDYRDVAVIAFRKPLGDTAEYLKPQSVSSNLKEFNLPKWLEGKDPLNVRADSPVPTWFEFKFDHPVTVRTVDFPSINSLGHGWCYVPETTVRVEAVDAGRTIPLAELPLPSGNWQEENYPFSIACSEATATAFRVTVDNRHPINLGLIRFSSAARKEDWQGEAGWTLRGQVYRQPPSQNCSSWISSSTVTNLTGCMNADGSLEWDAPSGEWVVLRVGHVNTGAKNGPAPAEGTGFECDKLSEKGADAQFAGYVGRLTAKGGALNKKLDSMLMDSWECRRQTWTEGFDKEFFKRCGYDVFTYMPALFGYVVDSPETTTRFLCDWRGLISDCIANRFYGRMAKLAHQQGLQIQFETSFGDVVPGDIMEYYKHADIPMCEFWQPHQGRSYVGSRNFKPVRPTVSAAHLYGKPRVAAEAFTSFALTWDEKLRYLKYVANLHMADGVTHMIFHTYTHNPRTDWLPPGTSFGSGIGTPFLRGQTWWKHMPEFTAYLARCGYMLEKGNPVSDVLWYLGDMLDHKPLEDAPFPDGYRFDYCNPDALLNRVKVVDGMWRTPDGISYRVLWIPECRLMLPDTLEKILDGLKRGGTVAVAAMPFGMATLSGGNRAKRRFLNLVETLWGKADPESVGTRKVGKGRLFVGWNLEKVLAANGIAPDVSQTGRNRVVWNHRSDKDSEWYFVTPDNPGGFSGSVGFRCTGDVEVLDPTTGAAVKTAAMSARSDRTWLSFDLEPSESRFVVFRRREQPPVHVNRVNLDGKLVADATDMSVNASCYRVVSARYGDLATEGRWVSVAEQLQRALDRGEMTFAANNEMAGRDPAYRTVKYFDAVLSAPDGREIKLSGKENETVGLPQFERVFPACTVEGRGVVAWLNGKYSVQLSNGVTEERSVSNAGVIPFDGTWNVRFPDGWGVETEQRISELKPWKDFNGTTEARSFSGTATYSMDFVLNQVTPEDRMLLDLGRVESIAVVKVNGRLLGTLWSMPYRVDITDAVKPGVNRLELEVTDTWFNRLVYDAGQPEANRKTWVIRGPSGNKPLHDSGCLGPVCLRIGSKLDF